MAILYLSAVEFIKRRPFIVWAPAFYHPHMPKDMVNPEKQKLPTRNQFKMVPTKRRNPMPFRQLIDPSQMQKASYTIEIMVDMFQKQIEFEIADEEDVVIILDNIDRYLISIQPNVEMGEETSVNYAKLLVRWRAEVYKHYYRYMMNNPVARDKLYPNNDKTQNLLYLLSAAGGIRQDAIELDPLKAKAKPPYDVAGSLPKDPTKQNEDDLLMESSLGLSNHGNLADNGNGFDFDDFLKR